MGPNIQIKFPEGEIVMFLDRSGQKQSIDPEYGVDVLTSLGDLDFDSCMERADRQEVEGLAVFRLSAADDKALKKQEAK